MGFDAQPSIPDLDGTGGPPTAMGQWTAGVGLAKDVAGIGLGVWNAMETSKMNKFMKHYYEGKQDMDRENFKSSARDYNQSVDWRAKVRSSAAGNAEGSDAMKASQAADMAKWGASETF
jgi:hypothetical protein